MLQVCNLWGGLIYLIAPGKTKVDGLEAVVQMAVPAPYYKCGKYLVSASKDVILVIMIKTNNLFFQV